MRFKFWNVFFPQELSKITMPIAFNEPLSFLQRMTEYMEHTYLINKACSLSDSIERMQVRDVFDTSVNLSSNCRWWIAVSLTQNVFFLLSRNKLILIFTPIVFFYPIWPLFCLKYYWKSPVNNVMGMKHAGGHQHFLVNLLKRLKMLHKRTNG